MKLKTEKLTIFRETPELWRISGKTAFHGMTLVNSFEYEKLKARLMECEKVLKGYEKSVFGGPAQEYFRKWASEYLSREEIFAYCLHDSANSIDQFHKKFGGKNE